MSAAQRERAAEQLLRAGIDVAIVSSFNTVNSSGYTINDGAVGSETCTIGVPFSPLRT